MNLCVNLLLEWVDEQGKAVIERVLWLDNSKTDVVTIELSNSKALPIWKKCQDLESAIANYEARILKIDPYSELLKPEEDIPQAHRQRRDRAWEIIAPIVTSPDGQSFISEYRGKLVAEVEKRTGSIKKTIYKYLRNYWQRGQTKNALLPFFHNCGGKGKKRKSSSKKRGRPSKLSQVMGSPLGVNVDDEIRKKFLRGIKLFYETSNGTTLKEAFQLTLEKFFHKGYEIQNGVLIPVLPPAQELPTFAQFRYWYEKERDITREKISREGQRRFNLRHRAILGNSTQMASGPGSIYQIDATVGDVYLVSYLDRNYIIGRPIIYVVIDVFSRMITGFSVSLEGPSWIGAMLALENTTTNKVTFCQEYGISINSEDWPCHHLPEAILADRGELEGFNADNLVNSLNIQLSNTSPYRADWKGIVERNFRLCNDRIIHRIPGAVNRDHERGDKDYRLDAVLDLYQFRKLMIHCILEHNQHHRMDWYEMDEFMIQDYVEPYPIDLWNWGIQNRVGHLRIQPTDVIRLNLLPSGEASVTPKGIYYKGCYYSCELALREQWFVKARNKGRWKVPIAYEPRFADIIYLRLNDGKCLEPCQLTEADQRFKGREWYEIIDYYELQKQAKEASKTRQHQSQAKFHAQVEQIISEAQEQTQKAQIPQSNRSRIQGIRQNRQLERQHQRETEAWKLGEKDTPKKIAQVVPIAQATQPEEDDEDYIAPSKPIDKLRKLREKKWNNDD